MRILLSVEKNKTCKVYICLICITGKVIHDKHWSSIGTIVASTMSSEISSTPFLTISPYLANHGPPLYPAGNVIMIARKYMEGVANFV